MAGRLHLVLKSIFTEILQENLAGRVYVSEYMQNLPLKHINPGLEFSPVILWIS